MGVLQWNQGQREQCLLTLLQVMLSFSFVHKPQLNDLGQRLGNRLGWQGQQQWAQVYVRL